MPIAPPKHKTKNIVKDRYHAPETIFIPQHKGMYGYKWKKQRQRFLLENPLCSNCGKVANVVDHKTPHKGNVNLFWDESNWQPLCFKCHNRKTAKHDGGFGRNKNVDNKSRQN